MHSSCTRALPLSLRTCDLCRYTNAAASSTGSAFINPMEALAVLPDDISVKDLETFVAYASAVFLLFCLRTCLLLLSRGFDEQQQQ
jgi:hypothetical protein